MVSGIPARQFKRINTLCKAIKLYMSLNHRVVNSTTVRGLLGNLKRYYASLFRLDSQVVV